MKSDAWHEHRSAGEKLLVALSKATPDALKTLQDHELDRVIVLLSEVSAHAGAERAERNSQARKTPER